GDEIIVIDLYGNTLMNLKSPTLPPHHDIRRLPDGNILTVNFVPEAFDLTMYGGSAEEIVFGDGYTIYDMNGNIVEQWDCFQEISPVDDPTIMDQLPVAGDGVGFNFKDDWLHANSIHYDSEGNIYMTFNWRSELWKIERATGKVLYRIGEDGNVDISSDAYASGMHSVEPQGVNEILVFDNGTNREDYISRALLYSVNENTMSATLSLKVEFPVNYSSPYMGNVQILNDDLLIYGSTLTNFIVFTDFNGNVLRTISNIDFQSYRSIYIPTIEKL
ncbi:MAG: aryl-sulfate sulfotransferase, partial [Rikenellaceae bacterium]